MKKMVMFLLIGAMIMGAAGALAEEPAYGEAHLWWEDYIVYYSVRAEGFDIQIRRQPAITEYGDIVAMFFDQSYIYSNKNTREVLAAVIPYQDADGSNKRAQCAIAALEYTFEADNLYDINMISSPRMRAKDFLSNLAKEKSNIGQYYSYKLNNTGDIYVLKKGYEKEITEMMDKTFP